MRVAALAVLIAAIATAAAADDFSGRGLLSFQRYDYDVTQVNGFRQTYDIRFDHALTLTSLVRLYVRAEDFRGTTTAVGPQQRNDSRQIQPVGEFLVNTDRLFASARSEYFSIRSVAGTFDSKRILERNSGQLRWRPDGLPEISLLAQRNNTRDDAAQIALTEENADAILRYAWRDFSVSADERYSRSTDPNAGYDRRTSFHTGSLGYTTSRFDGKFSVAADAAAQMINIDERSVGGKASSVPTPVAITKALYGIDDTPADDRDHPLTLLPALINGDQTGSTGVSLGTDSPAFQNIALDLSAASRLDEIRVIVRDPAGNPLRNGGGPVTFDVYTSDDGVLWTIRQATTTYSAPLSLYSVTFDLVTSRWFKIVTFGANTDPTFVTEIQAYYHTAIAAGGQRSGTQNVYNGTAAFTLQPVKKLTMSYSGVLSSYRQDLSGLPRQATTDLEQMATLQYDFTKAWSSRVEVLKRNVTSDITAADGARGLTMFVDFMPRRELKTTLEVGSQTQVLNGTEFVLDTRALHANALLLRSFLVTFDLGVQDQTLTFGGAKAQREFAALTGTVQLAPTLRLLATANLQRASSDSQDEVVQILGPTRDDRYGAELTWRPGRPLTLRARFGWLSGEALSGFTQRYHVDWYPFDGGSLSIAGSYDQDIDPTLDRKATRILFAPRWVMNRFVMCDLNFTSVTSRLVNQTLRQRTLYATVTLTK